MAAATQQQGLDPLYEEAKQKVARLRETFLSGRTRPLAWRRAQLLAFQKMMQVERAQFTEALKKDLAKSEFEGYNMEVNPVEGEIQHMLDHLEEWAAPEYQNMDPFKHLVISLTGHGRAALYRDPFGVVLVIGAWNYPIHLTLMPVVGAIACGNAVLVKVPSPKYSAASSALMAKLLPKYLDPDAIQVLEGGAEGTQAVLLPELKFDLIFFTGGTFVGKMVAQAAAVNLTPTVLELGGQNPVVIDKSADLPTTAKRLAWGKFTNAGQTCVTANHVYVHETVADKFIVELKKAIELFYGKTPEAQKASKDFPRIINARAHETLVKLLVADKRHIVYGGEQDASTLYIAPTIMDFQSDEKTFDSAAVMKDEIFGPILPILRYSDLNRLVGRIQRADKPLTMYVFTTDFSVSERLLRETTSGHAVVNDILMQFCAPIPFGGVGRSGMGRYHGKFSFDTFSHVKGVLKRHPWGEIPARFPPYGVPWKTFLVSVLTSPFSKNQVSVIKLVFWALVVALVSALLRRFGLSETFTSPLKNLFLWLANLL